MEREKLQKYLIFEFYLESLVVIELGLARIVLRNLLLHGVIDISVSCLLTVLSSGSKSERLIDAI